MTPSSPAPPPDAAAVAASYYSVVPPTRSSQAPSTQREPVAQQRVANSAPRGPKVALSYSANDFRVELARVHRVRRRIVCAVIIVCVLVVLLLVALRMGLLGV